MLELEILSALYNLCWRIMSFQLISRNFYNVEEGGVNPKKKPGLKRRADNMECDCYQQRGETRCAAC